ncbi:hypothetical protein L202_03726 [Cryptococcus amylolentus CBS 6039]|uniref:Uncharacterized protein n=1 Tax=Cryptococcus amylolentus CBS 6039 TaxID=1295533 RepID=A0A1E3HU28_9TREE|nr:hypothetical protein L202_03726 [Cryptococcus amylolentus CBS 6039]ODN79832.1 hypothetical protein L202_03726 [Cryptococcus amylolentus CBS 6039]
METPATNARKRPSTVSLAPLQASPQEPLICWTHDQVFRTAVMQATENGKVCRLAITNAGPSTYIIRILLLSPVL